MVGEPVGGHHPVVWGVERSDAKIIKIQYMVAFIGHQLVDQNTTTNQKQVAMAEGSMGGICDERYVWVGGPAQV
jgi:hypothetical protein